MKQICDDIIDRVQEYILPIGCSFDVERRNFIKELSTCDLLAVPGSGKTTALIAKLCCMAENLEDGEAILVLSHTNTAVEEIKKILKEKVQSFLIILIAYLLFKSLLTNFLRFHIMRINMERELK